MSDSTLRRGRRAAFVQVGEWVLVAPITPTAKALYTLLQAHVNDSRGDGLAWPGMQSLAELLGFSRRQSVTKYIRELEGLGAVDVHVVKTRWGRRNEYLVHDTPPEDHDGPSSLAKYYAARKALGASELDEQEKSDRRSEEKSSTIPGGSEGGGTPERTTHGTPERTRTILNPEPDEVVQDGPSAGDQADAWPQPKDPLGEGMRPTKRVSLKPGHLLGLPRPQQLQKIVACWSWIVEKEGGELPEPENLGDPAWYCGERTRKGNHPFGDLLGAFLRDAPDGIDEEELLEQALQWMRTDAWEYANRNRRAA